MPIHYISLTKKYREVPLREFRDAVEAMEKVLSDFRRERIGYLDFLRTWAKHRDQWSFSTVQEVFASDPELAASAEQVVDRNEMLYNVIERHIYLHWNGPGTLRANESVDEWLQRMMSPLIVVMHEDEDLRLPPLLE